MLHLVLKIYLLLEESFGCVAIIVVVSLRILGGLHDLHYEKVNLIGAVTVSREFRNL